MKRKKINVYIDDLDRGWKGKTEDINRISALFNAVRDISNEDENINFKISLRSDVYFLVRTSDESTDKIEGSVVWYTWTNHEILALLVKRIETFFGRPADEEELISKSQQVLSRYLDVVMESHFQGQGHWENCPIYKVLMSLIRKRPRDLVKLCSMAAKQAHSRNSNIINTQDFENIFMDYSLERIQDTENEFKSELPEIKELLFGLKPSIKKRKASESYVFTTEQLLHKIKTIMERHKFVFANHKSATPNDLLSFLYKINFITARRVTDTGMKIRKFFEENKYLSGGFVDFGFGWEIHPAYRWALQPDSPSDIFTKLELLDFE